MIALPIRYKNKLAYTAIIAVTLLCYTVLRAKANDGQKPNFLIFFIDDLGERDLGCYGNNFIETPHIDRLADEGMKWNRAYASCPVCSPTRAALLTGKNPARIHFTGHIPSASNHRYPDHGRIIPPKNLMFIPKDETILPEAIKSAGYVSISIGKWHVGHKGYWPTDLGFE